MVIDIHCHFALSGRRLWPEVARFNFERDGAVGNAGFDAYASIRILKSFQFRLIGKWLGVHPRSDSTEKLDVALDEVFSRHYLGCSSVDRLVILAFDETHDDEGRPMGPDLTCGLSGTDFYTSNSLVRWFCGRDPRRYLFGASIHPYRPEALAALDEVHQAGAVLVKWLPVHHNIDPADPRTFQFLRRCARLQMPLLIHYGGEMTTANHRPEQCDPRPMLAALSLLRKEGSMPTVVVAHVATPAYPWQSGRYFHALAEALMGEFRDAPLYADISALSNRPYWLWQLARNRRYRPLWDKLVFGSDFPIPVSTLPFATILGKQRAAIRRQPSWIEQAVQLVRALGFDEGVLNRGAEVLKERL